MTVPADIGRACLVFLVAVVALGAGRGSARAESLRDSVPVVAVDVNGVGRPESPDAPTPSSNPRFHVLAEAASLRLPGRTHKSADVEIGPAPQSAERANLLAWLRFLRPDEEVSDADPLGGLPRTDDLWRSQTRPLVAPTTPADHRPLVRRPRFAQARR